MLNIKSAAKRVGAAEATGERNISQKDAMRAVVRDAKLTIENNTDNKAELVSFAVKSVGKTVHNNLVHSDKADRIKSQLMSSSK